MLFNSFQFAIFLPIVLVGYYLLPMRYRGWGLLAASLWFYMSWDARLIVLIGANTLVHYAAAIMIGRLPPASARKRKTVLTLSVAFSLAILFFFKYFDFFSATMTALGSALTGVSRDPFILKLVLPMGISFYTFQTLSYTIDVYRGDVPVEKNFMWLSLYILFFPQLVAGPIERIDALLPQLKQDHPFSYDNVANGFKRMAIGFFKKIVVADTLAKGVNLVYNDVSAYTGGALVLATVLFAFQIFCDFSGYCDIALGCAKAMGIDLMLNFKSPYFSRSIKEFWSRWHISLSTWFRDYVYIPLGGNRRGPRRQRVNLLVTFLLSGLWHGANLTFVVWGAGHGLLQIAENGLSRGKKPITARDPFRPRHVFRVIGTFILVCLLWIFFRANTLQDAWYVVTHLLTGIANPVRYAATTLRMLDIAKVGVLFVALEILLLIGIDWLDYRGDAVQAVSKLTLPLRWAIYIAFVLVIVLFSSKGTVAAFIYFQF